MMNLKSTASIVGLALALSGSAALAQTTGTQGPTAVQKSDTTASQPAPKPVEGQIIMQSEDTILASVLKGASVYGPEGSSIGSITDLIVGTDGKIDGVVIGVGGFLGIGERNVAVKWDKLQLHPEDSGKVRLMLSATKDDLKNAPPFKSKAEQEQEKQVQQQRQAPSPLPGQPKPKMN
jgi:sporulation protein YlmC with PRC-barrel domain